MRDVMTFACPPFPRTRAASCLLFALALAAGCSDENECDNRGWDRVPLEGTIWSIDHQPPMLSPFVGVARFDRAPNGLLATYNGRPMDATVQNARELSWRRNAMGLVTERSFRATCWRPAASELSGDLTTCTRDGQCLQGTFRAVKLERRRGEGEASSNVLKLAEYGDFPGIGAITTNVRVDAGRRLAVLSRYADGLRILRLDPGPPYTITPAGHVQPEEWQHPPPRMNEIYNDVKLIDANGRNYATMASNVHGVVIFDITDPTQPVLKSHVRNGDGVHTHFIVGNMLYAADTSISGLIIADLSDPERPVEKGQFVLPNAGGAVYLHDLYVEPGRAYLDYWAAGLVIVDVTDPSMPRQVGDYTYSRMTNHSVWVTTVDGRKIAVTGDEDFTAHARVLDVTDPGRIRLIGEWGQERPQVSIHNILAVGDLAYATYYQDGLRILRLSDRSAPTQIGYFNSWSPTPDVGYSPYEGAIGVDKVGDIAYLADTERGLIVLRVP